MRNSLEHARYGASFWSSIPRTRHREPLRHDRRPLCIGGALFFMCCQGFSGKFDLNIFPPYFVQVCIPSTPPLGGMHVLTTCNCSKTKRMAYRFLIGWHVDSLRHGDLPGFILFVMWQNDAECPLLLVEIPSLQRPREIRAHFGSDLPSIN